MTTTRASDFVTTLDHSEIVRRFATDSSEAPLGAEFVTRYEAVIRNTLTVTFGPGWISGRPGAPPSLDDCVHEIYCRLFNKGCRALWRFRGRHENAIFAYLQTICRNWARNYFRDTARRQWFLRQASALLPAEDAADEAANGVIERHLLEDEVRAIFYRAFRPEYAHRNLIIFKLRYVYGYQYQEIARIKALGLSSQGVANAAARIRKRLLQEYSEPGDDEIES